LISVGEMPSFCNWDEISVSEYFMIMFSFAVSCWRERQVIVISFVSPPWIVNGVLFAAPQFSMIAFWIW